METVCDFLRHEVSLHRSSTTASTWLRPARFSREQMLARVFGTLRSLVTSREPLGVGGEHFYQEPLEAPG